MSSNECVVLWGKQSVGLRRRSKWFLAVATWPHRPPRSRRLWFRFYGNSVHREMKRKKKVKKKRKKKRGKKKRRKKKKLKRKKVKKVKR